ncbi:MAG: AMP-dependent synthetase, partial [Candidatus Latescibacteria bacterium]|nr:AMP-dependent synthetase [Candidatus Latescibacterota bacterium]
MAPQALTLEELTGLGMDAASASELLERINACLTTSSQVEAWKELSRNVLEPGLPFGVHRLVYERVYANWEPDKGPAPAWYPTEAALGVANITGLMEELDLDSYDRLLDWSSNNRSSFWGLMIGRLGIRFQQGFGQVADLSKGDEYPIWL